MPADPDTSAVRSGMNAPMDALVSTTPNDTHNALYIRDGVETSLSPETSSVEMPDPDLNANDAKSVKKGNPLVEDNKNPVTKEETDKKLKVPEK